MADFTQAQLDAINAAIANGTLEVEYGDKKVKYRTLSELLQVRDIIRQELGIIDLPTATRKYAQFNRGYNKNPE